jgi:DNA oxidative demethylase
MSCPAFEEVFELPVGSRLDLGKEACVLRGFACSRVNSLLPQLRDVLRQSSFRRMVTPGGKTMSVAMTNCGSLGWVSDRHRYRYTSIDPDTDAEWPAMPAAFNDLAKAAADAAGFARFAPDACLINRYLPRARLSLHQDKDEFDFSAPIVSVSLGVPAVFLFGGHRRNVGPRRVPLMHGDVVVWGGEDRLRFHGIAPVKEATHPLLGAQRINLTFRKAG